MSNAIVARMEEQNRAKYGAKDFDVISEGYRVSAQVGHGYCALNIKKYLRRFIGNSPKANNLVDLLKSRDYLDRMIEEAQKAASTTEVIEKA